MNKSLVLSFIGNDHPGLVSTISDVIEHHNGIWQESRLTQLTGKFAGILSLSIPDKQVENLRQALEALPDDSLHILLEACAVQSESSEETRNLTLEIVGNDRAGIVHDVTQVLANLGVNLEEVSTSYSDAPMSSEKLFRAEICAISPLAVRLNVIQEQLEDIANDLMIEIAET